MSRTIQPSPHPRHLLLRLQVEWDGMATDPHPVARARSWGLAGVEVTSLNDLLVASGLGDDGHSTAANHVLAAPVAVVCEARDQGLPPSDVELLARLASTECYAALAGELEVSTRTVRNRRDAAVHRLRRLVLAA